MQPLSIGLTGGIGAGKSLVARVYRCLGISVYDADKRARVLMETDFSLKKRLEKVFGKDIYVSGSGRLSSRALSGKVFYDSEALRKLNHCVHPVVRKDFLQWRTQRQNSPYVLHESALLFESHGEGDLDYSCVVTSPLSWRMAHIQARDSHRSTEEIHRIMHAQWDKAKARAKADFVIENRPDCAVLPKILRLHTHWQTLSKDRVIDRN